MTETSRKIMAVASGGGHWQQLMLLRPAFGGHQVLFVTTFPGLPDVFGAQPSVIVPDCNRSDLRQGLRCAAALARTMLRFRPDEVISTGALPGVLALALGRLFGARTIWIDSIANAEEMSMSGRLARRVAHLWLSQWEDVAAASGAGYAGAVL